MGDREEPSVMPTQSRFPPSTTRVEDARDPDVMGRVLAYQNYIRQRMQELTRIVGKAAAGDYSDKPEIVEEDDELSKFVVGFRFLLEDLEQGRDERRRRDTELREAYEKVKFQAALLEQQAEASPDGILVVDPEGKMLSFNERFVQMWGIPDEVVDAGSDQKAIESVLQNLEDPDEFVRRIEFLYEHREESSREEIRLKDGRVLDRHSAPLWSDDGRYYGRIWHFHDVTSAKRAADEIRASYERMKELDVMKTRFINMVAHELATPLTPLRLQLYTLQKDPKSKLTTEQRRALELLDRNIERLALLVRDVLDVARLEADALRLDPARIDLGEVVEQVVESYRAEASQRGVTLSSDREPGLDVEGDEQRLTQVMYNLLSNALKFTPRGGAVRVETRRTGGRVTVSVRDTGMGLEEEDFSKLFLPFSQVDDPRRSRHAGTGLGLYISKGIVERHGGRLWCDSEGRGKGSLFAFDMPSPQPGVDDTKAPRTCPTCRSNDLVHRVIKNKWQCSSCGHSWR